jgi:hypothetical protein
LSELKNALPSMWRSLTTLPSMWRSLMTEECNC